MKALSLAILLSTGLICGTRVYLADPEVGSTSGVIGATIVCVAAYVVFLIVQQRITRDAGLKAAGG